MNELWQRHRGWLKDCMLGLGYALIIILILLYSGANQDGFRYFEL